MAILYILYICKMHIYTKTFQYIFESVMILILIHNLLPIKKLHKQMIIRILSNEAYILFSTSQNMIKLQIHRNYHIHSNKSLSICYCCHSKMHIGNDLYTLSTDVSVPFVVHLELVEVVSKAIIQIKKSIMQ